MKKHNILMFVADQMRSDMMHHMGCEAAVTPNLDKLALEEGVSFRNAYCQNPVCVPSRCSFLTGWYPHTKGHRTMHYLLEDGDPNCLKSLKNAGYHVYWLGKNHLYPVDHMQEIEASCDEYIIGQEASDADIHGYSGKTLEEIKADEDYYSFLKPVNTVKKEQNTQDWIVVHKAMEMIEKGELKEPFCLYVSINFPHPPYTCEEPYYSMIDRDRVSDIRPRLCELEGKPSMLHGIYEKAQMKNWSDEKFKEVRAIYLGMIKRVDDQLGMMMEKLKEKGYYDDTAILFFADHGDYTGDYGITEKSQNTFEDCLTNVPLIIKPCKDMEVTPRISDALVELVDIPATLAQLCEIELGYVQFGKSLIPLIAKEQQHKDAVFCEGGRIHGERQAMEGVKSEESIYWPRLITQCEEGPQHTKAVMIRIKDYKYVYRLYEDDEFYDLKQDALECHNEIHNEKYQDIIQQCKNRMLQFMIETGDYVPDRRDKSR